ncbi:MAG: hypothetical protein U1F43_33335 [Myxococcota bacterium]
MSVSDEHAPDAALPAGGASTASGEAPAPLTRVPWLTPFRLDEGETASFRIASFALQVERRAREWRVVTATTSDLAAQEVDIRIPDATRGPIPFTQELTRARFAFDASSDGLRLRPRLADRTMVVRPADPLYLLPGATVDVFVSTVLWIVLELAPGGVVLIDRPAHRPSDTWFGPTTQQGELAYASRTSARLDPRELPRRAHRATTRIRLTNTGKAARSLARVMLPAPELELWQLPSGMLWTQTVELSLGDGDETPLRFKPGPPASDDIARAPAGAAHAVGGPPPAGAGPTLLVSPPRRLAQKNLLLRAMSAIF